MTRLHDPRILPPPTRGRFPIAEVSRHAVREKHLSWAQLPSASCRAVLMALLLPDPCDAHSPAAFNDAARHLPLAMHGHPAAAWVRQERAGLGCSKVSNRSVRWAAHGTCRGTQRRNHDSQR